MYNGSKGGSKNWCLRGVFVRSVLDTRLCFCLGAALKKWPCRTGGELVLEGISRREVTIYAFARAHFWRITVGASMLKNHVGFGKLRNVSLHFQY